MEPIAFTDASTAIEQAYLGSYSPLLVLLSLLIAILGTFVSISHLDFMRTARADWARFGWHLNGAVAMGVGVWTMHFIGMVAFRLPLSVQYDPVITLISVLPAIAAGFITLSILRHPRPGIRAIISGGILMGLGIGAMHYIGMAGMLLDARMLYQPGLFALSILVAMVMATAALWMPRLADRFRGAMTEPQPMAFKLLVATLMGLAISSLHYVAMSATAFLPLASSANPPRPEGLDEGLIAVLAILASLFILVLSIVTVVLRSRILAADQAAQDSERQALQLAERIRKIASRLPGMIYQFRLDPDGHMSVPYASQAVESIFGVTPETIRNDARPLVENIHSDDRQRVLESIRESARKLTVWRHEFRLRHEDQERWLQGNAIPERQADNTVVWNGFITDTTEQKRSADRIHELAFFDALTGLPNRRLLENRMDLALAASERHQDYGAVMFLDLDDFKSLNDTLGHSIGDDLLRELAERLRNRLRNTDTVARLGGDEFIIVAGELGNDHDQAARNAGQIAEDIIRTINEPVDLQGLDYRCAVSLGVSVFHGKDFSREELLRRADTAMYEAKSAGRNMVRFYDPRTQTVMANRFRLETELRQALEREEFHLVFQKQLGRTGRVTGVEALLRWHHPENGHVPPHEFIPIAEETGLIIPIGDWVLDQACQQIARWQGEVTTEHLVLSVNISAQQFRQPDFVENVESALDRAGAQPHGLCLELTESLILLDFDDAVHKMAALQERHLHLSMDDFGTGYSSMSYLTRLPFDEVKIDKSFVQQAGEDNSRREWIIIEAIIDMAHKLNMHVVAEGVETEQQHKLLSGLGCDLFQGFYLSRPAELNALNLSDTLPSPTRTSS